MCDQRDTFYFFNYLFFYKKFIFLSIAVIKKNFFYSSVVDLQCVPISAVEQSDTVIHK